MLLQRFKRCLADLALASKDAIWVININHVLRNNSFPLPFPQRHEDLSHILALFFPLVS